MQFSTLSLLKKSSLVKYLTIGLKAGVLLAMLFFLWLKLWQHEGSWQRMLQQGLAGWNSTANLWALAAVGLMPLNWLLEAVKWQLLASRISQLSLWQSIKAVLAGLSLGLITPRSLGDYAGRILVQGGQEKVRLVGAVMLNRIIQSLSTYIAGIAGILLLVLHLGIWQSDTLLWLLLPAVIGTSLTLLLMGPLRRMLIVWLQQKFGDKFVKWISVVMEYTSRELLLMNACALLRYIVFSFQFLLLLWWAGLQAPVLLLLAAVAATYLLKSILPGFNFLSDLGVREFSALLIFSLLQLPHPEVVAASLLLWIINICLPALIGALVVLQLKHKTTG